MALFLTNKNGAKAHKGVAYTAEQADAKFPAAKIATATATTAQATAGKIALELGATTVIGAPVCIAAAGTVRAITKVEIAEGTVTVTVTSLAKDDVLTFLYA